MENRAMDARFQTFGFRLQYNRLFKPEYLPARVRYNQFFFVVFLGVGVAMNRGKVSILRLIVDSIIDLTGAISIVFSPLFCFI